MDERLKYAINNPTQIPNIVVFETTGQNIPRWLLSKNGPKSFIPQNNYNVIFTYSLVNIDNLVERNNERFNEALLKFNENPNGPAPRLPDITRKKFTKTVSQIRDNAKLLYERCVISKNKKFCGNVPINRLIIFDNNLKKTKSNPDTFNVIYDSHFDQEKDSNNFVEIINKSLGLVTEPEEQKEQETFNKTGLKRKYSAVFGGKKRTQRNRTAKKFGKTQKRKKRFSSAAI